MNSEIDLAKSKVRNGELEEAINMTVLIADSIKSPEILNQSILLSARYSAYKTRKVKGLAVTETELNEITNGVLVTISTIEKSALKKVSCVTGINCNSNISKYNEVKNAIEEITNDINSNYQLSKIEQADLYQKVVSIQDLLSTKLKNRVDNYFEILCNRLLSNENITEVELNQILSSVHNENIQFQDKINLIFSITIRLLNKFDRILAEVLISYVLTFDKKIWSIALTSLLLVLDNEQFKILLYPKLLKKLEKLKEIKTIQDGINRIDFDLSVKNYEDFVPRLKGQKEIKFADEFWSVKLNWFKRFSATDPIIENYIDRFPAVKGIHELPQLLENDDHLSNQSKYWIIFNIDKFSKLELTEILNELRDLASCTDNHMFDTVLADYYVIIKYHLNEQAKSKKYFTYEVSLYDSDLLTFISSDYYRFRSKAVFYEYSNEYSKAVEFFLKAINSNPSILPCNYCSAIKILKNQEKFKLAGDLAIKASHFFPSGNFLNRAFDSYLKINDRDGIDQVLALQAKNENIKSIHTLGYFYYRLRNFEKALEHFIKAYKRSDEFPESSNMNLASDISIVYFVLGNTDAAKKFYSKIEPQNYDNLKSKWIGFILNKWNVVQRDYVEDVTKLLGGIEVGRLRHLDYMESILNLNNEYSDEFDFSNLLKSIKKIRRTLRHRQPG